MKRPPCILFLLTLSVSIYGQELVVNTLQKRSLPIVNLVTDGWVRYNKYAPHYMEGRAIMREYFKNEDSVTDKRFFCADIIAKDTLIMWWRLSSFRDEEVIVVDSFKDMQYKIPPIPVAKENALPDIEQTAYDYFISLIDTIKFLNSDTTFKFDKNKTELYFTKQTRSCPYSFLWEFGTNKKNLAFLNVKSDSELRRVNYYTDLGIKNIVANQPYVSTHVGSFNELEDSRKEKTDMKLKMWNRLFFKGNYYVYITTNERIDMVTNYFLIKIDKNGKPLGMIRAIHTL
jgi:hypothetical protein